MLEDERGMVRLMADYGEMSRGLLGMLHSPDLMAQQQMQRGLLGPGASVRAYHGSPQQGLKALNPDAYKLGMRGDSSALGVHFSTKASGAQPYSGKSGTVYGANVSGKLYPMTQKEFSSLNSIADFKKFRDGLAAKGYDGVRYPDSDDIAVWNPDVMKLLP
jgi:hypothetical protein